MVDDGVRRIGVDPALLPPEQRDPGRRLRGRLAAPVTVWTAGGGDGVGGGAPAERVGLTVSSVLVAEGEPPEVVGLLGPLSDFWDTARATKRFVLHVLGAGQAGLAERFAGHYPGDPYEGLRVSASPAGPVLEDCDTRAACSLTGQLEVGPGLLVRATLDEITVGGELVDPLVHFRGRYLTIASRLAGGHPS